MSSVDFAQQLRRQLGYLEVSSRAYDDGRIDEAIRLGTVMRVLFHNSRTSTSLLRHLHAENIQILSTAHAGGDDPDIVFHMGMGKIHVVNDQGSFVPRFDVLSAGRMLPSTEWWNEIVFVFGNGETRISRRDIVRNAVDRDGGAHVDAKLSDDYFKLGRPGLNGSIVFEDPDGNDQPLLHAHLVALRQMAHELLHSPELLALQR